MFIAVGMTIPPHHRISMKMQRLYDIQDSNKNFVFGFLIFKKKEKQKREKKRIKKEKKRPLVDIVQQRRSIWGPTPNMLVSATRHAGKCE